MSIPWIAAIVACGCDSTSPEIRTAGALRTDATTGSPPGAPAGVVTTDAAANAPRVPTDAAANTPRVPTDAATNPPGAPTDGGLDEQGDGSPCNDLVFTPR